MKNETNCLPSEFTSELPDVKTVTFEHEGRFYTFAKDTEHTSFMKQFPDHTRVTALLESSGSSWSDHAFLFYVEDCFDPPVYVQFGASFQDAYESYADNDPSLIIEPSEYADYEIGTDCPSCSFDSNGAPIDSESVKGFGPLKLVSVTF